MTADDLLSRFDAVRPRGGGRWVSRCPAHDDRSPSLSIAEGDKGLLLKCWAGCELSAICEAVGITAKDLFYGSSGQVDRDALRRKQAKREAARARRWATGKRQDALRE